MIDLKITSDSLDEMEAALALVTVYEDVRPLKGQAGLVDWRMNGYLSEIIMQARFAGTRGEALLMPTQGRIPCGSLMVLGLGKKSDLHEGEIPRFVAIMLEKLLLKKDLSFCLSLSELAPAMFEWRNAVRLFMSMLSGRSENFYVSLLEPAEFVDDARKRHMDFAYDVQVQYR